MKVALLLLFLTGTLSAVTKEVIRVYQPLSYHFTDSAVEQGPRGQLVQAEVVPRAMVLSGAFPEDLVRAVFLPCRLPTNNEDYDVEEANLLVLCEFGLETSREESELEIIFDCSKIKLIEPLELELSVVLEMGIESIRRTLRLYYRDGGDESLNCHITLSGLTEKNASLKKLETNFPISEPTD